MTHPGITWNIQNSIHKDKRKIYEQILNIAVQHARVLKAHQKPAYTMPSLIKNDYYITKNEKVKNMVTVGKLKL